jgi:hypothetical protein
MQFISAALSGHHGLRNCDWTKEGPEVALFRSLLRWRFSDQIRVSGSRKKLQITSNWQ